eukprot:scaffold12.g8107.t1
MLFNEQEQWALWLSTLAGLSTTVGAAFAVIRRPDAGLLAFLLGTAIGVMLLLSVVEMWIHNAMDNGWPEITGMAALGALVFQLVHPFLPDFEPGEKLAKQEESGAALSSPRGEGVALERLPSAGSATGGGKARRHTERRPGAGGHAAALGGGADGPALLPQTVAPPLGGGGGGAGSDSSRGSAGSNGALGPGSVHALRGGGPGGEPHHLQGDRRPAELLRLGLLMSVTMTLHNLPEGFAVCFSAFTDFGPVMALAIAVHNIPEGVIVAAPVFAATGSRWKAVGIATASGLSEPLGALLALLVVRPFLTHAMLQYILAFVGGIMACVCVVELWPEARKCRQDRRMALGIAFGSLLMGGTLLFV